VIGVVRFTLPGLVLLALAGAAGAEEANLAAPGLDQHPL
jgi:hypothetical protein